MLLDRLLRYVDEGGSGYTKYKEDNRGSSLAGRTMGILKNLGDLQRVTVGLDCLAGGLVILLQRDACRPRPDGLISRSRRAKEGSLGHNRAGKGFVSGLRSFLSYSAALGHNRWRLEAPSFHRLCTTLLQLSRAVTFHFCRTGSHRMDIPFQSLLERSAPAWMIDWMQVAVVEATDLKIIGGENIEQLPNHNVC